ncbi:MAG: pyruvate kinase [Gammaproteobacteria bacterium]|nr:MAG: pyruvate kinase [Gammaproteobacteria bacterium]
MPIPRRTKIVATVGPATESPKMLRKLIRAGADVVRINFSHGSPEEHIERARNIREAAEKVGRHVGILADLQGPKIRIERFKDGFIDLEDNQVFTLDAALGVNEGDENAVGLTYKALTEDVNAGDVLLLDDGLIVLKVNDVTGSKINCTVEVGGKLSDNKGVNRQGGGLSAGALTEKDQKDIKLVADIEADFLAVSFVRSAEDVHEARRLLHEAGSDAWIVSKIERAEAIDVIEEITLASDVLMVARGDLGVEIGDAEITAVQKKIITQGRNMDRVVITATQMLESMIDKQMPTRAEVTDVANAVLDGTDAVMLSAETAVGKFPVKAIKAMDRICRGAEKYRGDIVREPRNDESFERIDEAIAKACMYTANRLHVRAIIAMTESGATALWMSRISSGLPIYAMSSQDRTLRQASMYRGVEPIKFDTKSRSHARVNTEVLNVLKERGAIEDGDMVIISKGDLVGKQGGTNVMKILRVGDNELQID